MSIKAENSQMADSAGFPMIGSAQATITDPTAPTAVTGLANNSDVATLVALKTELEATNTAIGTTNAKVAAIIDALQAHGLVK